MSFCTLFNLGPNNAHVSNLVDVPQVFFLKSGYSALLFSCHSIVEEISSFLGTVLGILYILDLLGCFLWYHLLCSSISQILGFKKFFDLKV